MEIKTTIEIQRFGDFGIKHTECIMVSSIEKNVDELINLFCAINGITKRGLPLNKLSHYTEEFIKYLETEGFYKLKTRKFYFVD